jgi:hypothetical protein
MLDSWERPGLRRCLKVMTQGFRNRWRNTFASIDGAGKVNMVHNSLLAEPRLRTGQQASHICSVVQPTLRLLKLSDLFTKTT